MEHLCVAEYGIVRAAGEYTRRRRKKLFVVVENDLGGREIYSGSKADLDLVLEVLRTFPAARLACVAIEGSIWLTALEVLTKTQGRARCGFIPLNRVPEYIIMGDEEQC